MDESVDRMLNAAGPQIAPAVTCGPGLRRELLELNLILARKNGFYAFESALHVFPDASVSLPERSLTQWNNPRLWKGIYGGRLMEALCFAEDIFGGQFALIGSRVKSFDPEIGEFSDLSNGIAEWCAKVLSQYNYMTGYSVGHAWQTRNGALRPGHRLIPRIPFCFGGEFSVENMIPVESVNAMRYRAAMAIQINGETDGKKFRFDPSVAEGLACDRGGVGSGSCGCVRSPSTDYQQLPA